MSASFLLAALAPATVDASAPLGFGPTTDFPAGAMPYDIVSGDLNGDGKLDLAVLDINDNAVSVLLGDGTGGFGPRTSFPTGLGSWKLAVGDLNRDGKLDLVVTTYSSNAVAVLLGNGDGTFQPRIQYGAPGPIAVAIGDMNGDGKLDLVVTLVNSGGVAVLLGNGDGTFQSRVDFPVTFGGGHSLRLADLDHDGDLDVAMTNSWGNSISVLLGDGAGNLGPSVEYPIVGAGYGREYTEGIAVADLNGDGHPDLVTTGLYTNLLSVFFGDGTGGFGPRTDITVGSSPCAIAIADVDGDAVPDLVCTHIYANSVSVLLGNGTGGFGAGIVFPTGTYPLALAVADLDGDGSLDLATANAFGNDASVLLNTTAGNLVAPQPPETCITPAHPCVEVPVTISRTGTSPLRGFSVTVRLSGNLASCPPIVQGTYLSDVAGTHYEVLDNHDGSYTLDCAILGGTCGATAPTGTLFIVNVGSSAASGTGTVTVTDVTLRDCDNHAMTGSAGPPASLTIDNTAPVAITNLAAAQVKTGNDLNGTTRITVSWPAVESGATVHVYRAPYGHYPEYDMGGAVPALPAYPPGAPWELARDVSSGTSFDDEVAWPARDFWYYVAFVEDACGNLSGISNRTGGTLNYLLGDVHNGAADCSGDNQVWTEDVSFLGAHYGVSLADPDVLGCLDVGPTTDGSVDARPVPDDRVNFEDLMLFAINYAQLSKPPTEPPPGPAPEVPPPPPPPKLVQSLAAVADELKLEGPAKVVEGTTFTVSLRLAGAGDLQGLSLQLGWDRAVAEPVSVEAGALLAEQNGVVFSSQAGDVDAALLGANRGLTGEGVLATVTFRALASGTPNVTLAKVVARDATNQPVALAGVQPTTVPATTSFAAPMPNPFQRTTVLSYALAKGGAVELAVYGVDGRKVATLASGVQEAGQYRLSWDGAGARPGMYYARLTTPEGRFTRTLVLMK